MTIVYSNGIYSDFPTPGSPNNIMITTATLKHGLTAAVCSMLMTACAPDLPELPVYAPVTTAAPAVPADSTQSSISEDISGDSRVLAYVASDLVAGLSYISGISPNLISLRTPSDETDFDNFVTTAVLNNGYSVDGRFDRQSSAQLATSFFISKQNGNSYELTAIISVDSILVKRTYAVRGNAVNPQTSYLIRGVNPLLVNKNEQVRVL